MQTQALQQRASERRFNLMLWIAMLCSIAMYSVVMRLVPPAAPAAIPTLVTVLTAAAFSLAAVSFAVKSRLFATARETGKPELRRAGQILAMVLCEAAALMGVVAWFLTGSPRSYYAIVVGFVGILLHYPRGQSAGTD